MTAVGHLVCSDGVSGDMLLGALVDAGAPIETIHQAVSRLGLGDVELVVEPASVRGVASTRLTVEINAKAPRVETFEDACTRIRDASIQPAVAESSMRAFERLAAAEAQAHGTEPDSVTFHELGDPDTIVDIVGVLTAVHSLGVQSWTCGPISVGGGVVPTRHGPMSVPVPAVTALLGGFFVAGGGRQRELATPTGACLVATIADPVEHVPSLRLEKTGRGSSSDAESGLTVLLGVRSDAALRPAVIIEATIDDTSPEFLPVVLEKLRAEGAQDAWLVPTLMKKGRPGYEVKVLALEEDVPHLAAIFFTETSTIGVRSYAVVKRELSRYWISVMVGEKQIDVKIAEENGRVLNVAPEFEDVQTAAKQLERPLEEVRHEAVELARRTLDGDPL